MQIVNAAAHTTVNLGMIKKVMMLARVLRMFRLLRHLRVSEGGGRRLNKGLPSLQLCSHAYCCLNGSCGVLHSAV